MGGVSGIVGGVQGGPCQPPQQLRKTGVVIGPGQFNILPFSATFDIFEITTQPSVTVGLQLWRGDPTKNGIPFSGHFNITTQGWSAPGADDFDSDLFLVIDAAATVQYEVRYQVSPD